jgi:nucleoside-diphosphate-sugar epimerase
VDRTWADISRAGRDLEWAPEVGLNEGLDRFIEWFRGEQDLLLDPPGGTRRVRDEGDS